MDTSPSCSTVTTDSSHPYSATGTDNSGSAPVATPSSCSSSTIPSSHSIPQTCVNLTYMYTWSFLYMSCTCAHIIYVLIAINLFAVSQCRPHHISLLMVLVPPLPFLLVGRDRLLKQLSLQELLPISECLHRLLLVYYNICNSENY